MNKDKLFFLVMILVGGVAFISFTISSESSQYSCHKTESNTVICQSK